MKKIVAAVGTILLADLVMSLDNVIAVAAVAKGDSLLLILGLGISIPLVVFGSTLMIRLAERFPIIVLVGATLIGWVGRGNDHRHALHRPSNPTHGHRGQCRLGRGRRDVAWLPDQPKCWRSATR